MPFSQLNIIHTSSMQISHYINGSWFYICQELSYREFYVFKNIHGIYNKILNIPNASPRKWPTILVKMDHWVFVSHPVMVMWYKICVKVVILIKGQIEVRP